MIQEEEKQLLLQDLCARCGGSTDNTINNNVNPYFRPMSSDHRCSYESTKKHNIMEQLRELSEDKNEKVIAMREELINAIARVMENHPPIRLLEPLMVHDEPCTIYRISYRNRGVWFDYVTENGNNRSCELDAVRHNPIEQIISLASAIAEGVAD